MYSAPATAMHELLQIKLRLSLGEENDQDCKYLTASLSRRDAISLLAASHVIAERSLAKFPEALAVFAEELAKMSGSSRISTYLEIAVCEAALFIPLRTHPQLEETVLTFLQNALENRSADEVNAIAALRRAAQSNPRAKLLLYRFDK